MNRLLSILTNLFPLWVLLGGGLALVHPNWVTWFSGDFITWGLAVIMLGMGITLSVDDFKAVLKMPRAVGIGIAAHFAIMPFLGWSIAHLLRLETPFAVGLIYLDNFTNVQSLWVTQGQEIGQVALKFGANDLGSIMIEENVVSQAGTTFRITVADMHRLIQDFGYEPYQRDNWYRPVK